MTRVQAHKPTFRGASNKDKGILFMFHMKHNLNTFILVACTPDKGKVRLYPGSRILELVDSGLKLEPLACGLEPSVRLLESL